MNIPAFPLFAKLTYQHKDVIKKYTSKYKPFSDFNFISIYCWNIDGKTEISELNGNLVLRMKDYHHQYKIYSYIGNKEPEHTLKKLFEYPLIKKLTFVPTSNFTKSNYIKDIFLLEYDRNHFDYIYSTKELSLLEGSKYHNKRNLAKRFENTVQTTFEVLDLNDKSIQKQIIRLNIGWTRFKSKFDHKEYSDEMEAIQRFFQFSADKNIIAYGLYEQKRLITFIFVELLPRKFAIVHFKKCNLHYTGITEYSLKKLSEYLYEKDYLYMNFEQDLGVEGLRRAKLSNRPISFLKKYSIKRKLTD